MSMAEDEAEEFATLFECCPGLLSIANFDGYFTRINNSWSTTLGYSEQTILSKPFVEFVHPDDVQSTTEEIQALASGSYTSLSFQNRFRKQDGSYIWLAWGARAKGNKIYAVAKDITAVKGSESFLAEIQKHAKIGGWSLNTDDLTTTWTDETYRIHEVPVGTPTELEKGIAFFLPEYRDKIRRHVADCIDKKKDYDDLLKITTAKGRQLWVRATGHPVIDDTGRVCELIGTFHDVDNLKALTDSLEATKSQLNDVLNNSPGMVYQFQMEPDGEMSFPYTSPQTFEIYEIAPEEFKKDPSIMLKMSHPEDQDDLLSKITASAQSMSPFEWTGRILTASKKIKWIKAKSVPRNLESGAILWNGIVVDMTKEKELEHNLSKQRKFAEHQSRLASLGEIAAGVGHEINNPLAIVMGKFTKLSKEIAALGPNATHISQIITKQMAACERIRKIVQGLRNLAHADSGNEQPLADLTDSIQATVDLVTEIYGKEGVRIAAVEAGDERLVGCTATHVQQILINLLSNAKDASKLSANPTIRVRVDEQDDFFTLVVSDNGTGISAEYQDKMFNAFFTTKDVGHGTGLGLALCKSMIESCGGKIWFETGSQGTTFFVSFPKANQRRPQEPRQSDGPLQQVVLAPLKVLLVDDEDDIREILSELLEESHCNVTAVPRAEQALEAVKTSSFDLIITDVMMPGMDGISLLTEISQKNLATNATKIIITGGIVDDPTHSRNRDRMGIVDGYLNKPFDTQDMLEIIKKAQDRRKAILKSA